MKILVKMLSQEVKSVSGFIVYVLSETDQSIEAETCDLNTLVQTIEKFTLKYKI